MLKNLILIILPITFLGFPILKIIASNKLSFLYEDEYISTLGFKLEEKTWGPTFKDSKKVFISTNNQLLKKKACQAIKLHRFSYLCLLIFITLYVIQLFI